ncbi:DUF2809 domain-containing protein [Christensenellaceae bacterium NSJ-53]|uniref:DUF2809 domain-containing protein n=2 Tax=Gehongia tenuis TaxID=2763655 RepID=A0A926D547_9FIRM|nr:DUF2809 domain-containing protein [Gehongia tenuis]
MEIFIALYVRDDFVRPLVGDALVIVLLYAFFRIFIHRPMPFLPLLILLFAAAVEVSQVFDLVGKLGLGDSKFFRTLLGSTFDPWDLVFYGLTALGLGLFERHRKGRAGSGRS